MEGRDHFAGLMIEFKPCESDKANCVVRFQYLYRLIKLKLGLKRRGIQCSKHQ